MSAYSRHSKTGRLQLCLWAGATEPDLTDDTLWYDIDDAEALVAELATSASVPHGASNIFTPAGAARVWARWNSQGSRK